MSKFLSKDHFTVYSAYHLSELYLDCNFFIYAMENYFRQVILKWKSKEGYLCCWNLIKDKKTAQTSQYDQTQGNLSFNTHVIDVLYMTIAGIERKKLLSSHLNECMSDNVKLFFNSN